MRCPSYCTYFPFATADIFDSLVRKSFSLKQLEDDIPLFGVIWGLKRPL